jgi:hypothetical protein
MDFYKKIKRNMKKIILTGEFESSKIRLRGNSVKNDKVVRKSALSRLLKKLKK